MKINWGTKLAIAMAAFMIMITTFVVLMMREDISLVETDYYPKGQQYQEIIDKKQHSSELKDSLSVVYKDDKINIHFPANMDFHQISGKVQLYNRMSSKLDLYVNLLPDSTNTFGFKTVGIHGRYVVKIEWNYQGISYFNEEPLTIK